MSQAPSIGVRSAHAVDGDLTVTPEFLKAVQAFLSFVDVGVGIEQIFDIEMALAQHSVGAAHLKYLKSNPEIAQLFEERYLPPTASVEELLKLPEDSLGFAYASNLRSVNYQQDYYPKFEVTDDATYYIQRMRQTHDIWHTVSGYGLTDFGGVGLGAFQFANIHDPLTLIMAVGALMHLIKANPDYVSPVILILQQGYYAGLQAKPFLAQKWEEAWEKPLADWRAELNVPPLKYKNFEEAALAASRLDYSQMFGLKELALV